MPRLRPLILVGIGPQARQTVAYYLDAVRTRWGKIPAILPVILDFVPGKAPFRRAAEGIEHLTLVSPVFEAGAPWPGWLPDGLAQLTPMQREHTRAWMHAALVQKADEWQEFLLESIPNMCSLAAVEAMHELGVALIGDGEIDVYVLADVNEPLGSSSFVDIAYFTAHVCRQLSFKPHVSGVLYLPGATTPAPAEEALAYAALKELDAYMRGRRSTPGFMPDWAPVSGQPPFTDGCYLVDDVNEAGYTLSGETQKAAAVGEWLYAMTLLGMQETVRGQRNARYQRGRLRGRSRAYESMGVTIGYVPIKLLQSWSAALLGRRAVDRVLAAPPDSTRAEQATRSFIEPWLRVDALVSQLRQQAQFEVLDDTLGAIERGPLSQADVQARYALQTLREKHLPALDRSLLQAAEQAKQKIHALIRDESRMILHDNVSGAVPRALQLGQELQTLIATLRQEANALSADYQVQLKQSLSTVSQSHYGLRSVLMSVPPWPITALCALALVIMPLLYLFGLIGRTISSLDPIWAVLASTLLGAGVLVVASFVMLRQARQRRLVYEQHRHMVRERFELESKPLLVRALREIYNNAEASVASIQAETEALSEALGRAAVVLGEQVQEYESQLNALATPGPFRALVDVAGARHYLASLLSAEHLGDRLSQFTSSVSEWQAECAAAHLAFDDCLVERLVQAATRYVEPHLQDLTALRVLKEEADAGADGLANLWSSDLERMFDGAHPMWSYNPQTLRRARTQLLAFFGVDCASPNWAHLAAPLSQICPDVIPVDTGDPFSLVAMRVHSGLSLFALRRIGEYRTHYAEMLWRSKLPMHVSNELSLVNDLIPARRRPWLPIAALFTAGLALEFIYRDTDGRYLAPRGVDEMICLSADKERAAALMSLDPATCLEVQHRLDAWVEDRGRQALRHVLDQYTASTTNLADWELQEVVRLQVAYRLEGIDDDQADGGLPVAQSSEVRGAT